MFTEEVIQAIDDHSIAKQYEKNWPEIARNICPLPGKPSLEQINTVCQCCWRLLPATNVIEMTGLDSMDKPVPYLLPSSALNNQTVHPLPSSSFIHFLPPVCCHVPAYSRGC